MLCIHPLLPLTEVATFVLSFRQLARITSGAARVGALRVSGFKMGVQLLLESLLLEQHIQEMKLFLLAPNLGLPAIKTRLGSWYDSLFFSFRTRSHLFFFPSVRHSPK